jgi:hypothetical protein
MSQTAASRALAENTHASTVAETRLRGRWLRLARIAWVVVGLFTLSLFVGSLPAYFLRLQVPCMGAAACNLNGVLDAAGIRTLQMAGFSLRGYAAYTITLTLAIALIWVAVGLVIFWRRSDEGLALLVALALVLSPAGLPGAPPFALALTTPAWNVPVEVVAFMNQVTLGLFLFLFPSGRFAPRWTRWVLAGYLVLQLGSIFPPADSPLNATTMPGVLYALLIISFLGTAVFAQRYRYHRVSNPVQRQQIKWAVFGISTALVLDIGVTLWGGILTLNQLDVLYRMMSGTLYSLALLPIPLSIGVAILRYRLWDIDTIINKALVYGLLTGLLGALYAGLIIGLESLVGVITGQAAQPVVIVVSTLAIAALFLPVRQRIQAIIDRRFYRKKYDAEKTLAAFSTTLQSEVDLEQIYEQLLAVVQETMQPAHISLWLCQPEQRKPPAAHKASQNSLQGELR